MHLSFDGSHSHTGWATSTHCPSHTEGALTIQEWVTPRPPINTNTIVQEWVPTTKSIPLTIIHEWVTPTPTPVYTLSSTPPNPFSIPCHTTPSASHNVTALAPSSTYYNGYNHYTSTGHSLSGTGYSPNSILYTTSSASHLEWVHPTSNTLIPLSGTNSITNCTWKTPTAEPWRVTTSNGWKTTPTVTAEPWRVTTSNGLHMLPVNVCHLGLIVIFVSMLIKI